MLLKREFDTPPGFRRGIPASLTFLAFAGLTSNRSTGNISTGVTSRLPDGSLCTIQNYFGSLVYIVYLRMATMKGQKRLKNIPILHDEVKTKTTVVLTPRAW